MIEIQFGLELSENLKVFQGPSQQFMRQRGILGPKILIVQ